MSENDTSITPLFIQKEDGRSTVRIYTASPTPLEEKNLGGLFAVMEIDSQDSVNNDILQVIIDVIGSHYYRSETFQVEAAFEAALQKTNQRLQEMIAEIGEEWLSSLNIIIGVQKGSEMIFANIGRVISLMVHKGSVVDILDTTKAKSQTINPVKIFGNIVTGELPEHSVVLFATETILDYLSKEKIKRILMDSKPEDAAEDFYQLLEEDTTNTNFAGVIVQQGAMELQVTSSTESSTSIPVVNAPLTNSGSLSSDSMDQLLGRQNTTEELLSPSLWPGLRKGVQSYFNKRKKEPSSGTRDRSETYTADHERPVVRPQWQKVLLSIGKGLWTGLIFLKNITGKAFVGLVAVFRKSPNPAPSYGGNRRQQRARGSRGMKDTAASFVSQIIKWFSSFSVLQKIFFIVALIVLVIFAQSVVTRGEKKITKENETEYSQTISAIDLKINEGKAAAIYDNEEARALFIAARDQLNTIPTESDSYKERGEELASVIADALRQANNITTIANPELVLDYTSINPNIEIGKLILLGASMYGFDKNSLAVYRGNLETRSTSVTISEPNRSATVEFAVKASPGTGIVGLSDGTKALFNPITEAFTTVELTTAKAEQTITDIVVFGVRLYTLDTLNGQIFRHRRIEDTFESGEAWLTDDSASLTNAVSLAIDGSVYVLKDNGNVIRLSSGSKDNDFVLAEIDPTLEHGTKLFTDENSEQLYILDRTGKRVVVFGKNGSLVAQYTSDSFDDLNDMVVDEGSASIYVLNGPRVYKIGL